MMEDLQTISEEDFRAWCLTVGVRFNDDEDTGTINTNQSLEDMIDFAIDVLEKFGPNK